MNYWRKSFKDCLFLNRKLCEKLFSSVAIMNRKVKLVAFFVAGHNFSSWESDNLAFTLCTHSFYIYTKMEYQIKFIECNYSPFTVLCESSRIRKNTVAFPTHSRFPVKSICSIYFGSVLSTFCLLRSIAISLFFSLNHA